MGFKSWFKSKTGSSSSKSSDYGLKSIFYSSSSPRSSDDRRYKSILEDIKKTMGGKKHHSAHSKGFNNYISDPSRHAPKAAFIAIGAVLGFLALLMVFYLVLRYRRMKSLVAQADEETFMRSTGAEGRQKPDQETDRSNSDPSPNVSDEKIRNNESKIEWNLSENTLATERKSSCQRCCQFGTSCAQCSAAQIPLPESNNEKLELEIDQTIDGQGSIQMELGEGDERIGYAVGEPPIEGRAKSETAEIAGEPEVK